MISSNIDIGEIHIEKPNVELTKKDVNTVLAKLHDQATVWKASKGPAQIGDKVMVEYRITSNGRVVEDTTGKPLAHDLCSNSARDALGKRLLDRQRGERFEFIVQRTRNRKKHSQYRTPGRYAVCITKILRKNERKSKQALAALFGRKTIRQDMLYREVKQTMLARLDVLVRREVKSQVFNALYSGNGGSLDDPCFNGTVDQARYREVVAEQVQAIVHKHELNLDYNRVISTVAALAERSANPKSTERKYHDNTELLSRIEATILEDQVVELVLNRASVKSIPIQYQAFIAPTTNSTTPESSHEHPRSSIVELTSATKCGYCSNNKCCQYITQHIPTPRSKSDFSHLLWQVSHENINVFKDEEGWNLLVITRCSHLQMDGRCGVYANRPDICRNYKNDYCEFEGPAEEGYKLSFHGYEELLVYCQKRFKRWNEYAARR